MTDPFKTMNNGKEKFTEKQLYDMAFEIYKVLVLPRVADEEVDLHDSVKDLKAIERIAEDSLICAQRFIKVCEEHNP